MNLLYKHNEMKMFYVFMFFSKITLSKDLRPLRGNNKKKRTNGGNIIFFPLLSLNEKKNKNIIGRSGAKQVDNEVRRIIS